MVNLTAPLRIAVTATGERTLLADIARLVEAAEQGRARFVALADRVARMYAPVVHVLAAATFLGWLAIGGIDWQPALLNAVAVLIITCPCALALAVPVVQVDRQRPPCARRHPSQIGDGAGAPRPGRHCRIRQDRER